MRRFLLTAALMLGMCSAAAIADYSATQGVGTTFGSMTAAGVHYVKTLFCDATAAAQCAAVKAASTAAAQTDPALVVRNADTGTTSDAAATAGGTGTIHAKLRLMTTQLDNINTNIQASLPAGTAIIGGVHMYDTAGSTKGTIKAASTAAVLSDTALVVTPILQRGSRNFPGCTVGATTTNCLASSTALTFLQVQNVHASNTIACAFGVSAVLNDKSSVQLAAGQSASWGPNTMGVPTGQLNCIASAGSTPMYLEWN